MNINQLSKEVALFIKNTNEFKSMNKSKLELDKNKNLKLAVITIDLTNVIAPNGKQVYKGYFEKVREVLKDNELCNI